MRLSAILLVVVDFVALTFLDTDGYQATGTISFPYAMSIAQQCIASTVRPTRPSTSNVRYDGGVDGISDPPSWQSPTYLWTEQGEAISCFYTSILALEDIIKQSGIMLREPDIIMSDLNMLSILTQRHYSNWQYHTVRLLSDCDSILESYDRSNANSKNTSRGIHRIFFWKDYNSDNYQEFRASLQRYGAMQNDLAEIGHQLHRVTILSEKHLDALFQELIAERSSLLKVKEQQLARIITLLFRRHRNPCPEMQFLNRIISDVLGLKQILVNSRLHLENAFIFMDELYSASTAYLASTSEDTAHHRVIIGMTRDWRQHID